MNRAPPVLCGRLRSPGKAARDLAAIGVQSGKRDSNPRPQPWQGCALPTELFPRWSRFRCSSERPPWPTLELREDRPTTNASPGGGGEGNRTPDLLNAIQALSQLSYAPSAERIQLFRQETRSVVRGRYDVKKFRAGVIQLGRYFAALSNPIGARAIQGIGPPAILLGLAAPMTYSGANAPLTIHQFTRSTSRARQ